MKRFRFPRGSGLTRNQRTAIKSQLNIPKWARYTGSSPSRFRGADSGRFGRVLRGLMKQYKIGSGGGGGGVGLGPLRVRSTKDLIK